MIGLLRIAFRRALSDWRRSLPIGISLFISCIVLLVAEAVANGAGTQLLRRHRAVQSGDVVVIWKNVLEEVDPADPGRILFSAFEGKDVVENAAAIARLDSFLSENARSVSAVYRSVRAFGTLDTGELAAYCMIYGVSVEELAHLQASRALELEDGASLFDQEYGAYISRETADKNGIGVGDYVSLDAATQSGLVNSMDVQVAGIYRNGAPWDNITVYVREEDARSLLEWDDGCFSSARIHLRAPGERRDFALRLDAALAAGGSVLRAETSDVSTAFWATFSLLAKQLFAFFVLFLLLVIAAGIRGTIRTNLFQRIQEFGTLRPIGYARRPTIFIIFSETFLISLLSLTAACALAAALVLVLSRTGIRVGTGPAGYVFGGEYVYPILRGSDLAAALGIVAAFSLLAVLGPGMDVCFQRITDLLTRRQRPGSALASVLARRVHLRKGDR